MSIDHEAIANGIQKRWKILRFDYWGCHDRVNNQGRWYIVKDITTIHIQSSAQAKHPNF